MIKVISFGIPFDCINPWADESMPKRRPANKVPTAVLLPTSATAIPVKPYPSFDASTRPYLNEPSDTMPPARPANAPAIAIESTTLRITGIPLHRAASLLKPVARSPKPILVFSMMNQ